MHVKTTIRGMIVMALAASACSSADNAPPVPGSPGVTIDEDTVATLDLLEGATDPEGDALHAVSATADAKTVLLLGDSKVQIQPKPDFHGEIAVQFELSDGTSTVAGHATITVRPVNDAPVATGGTQQIHGPAVVLLTAGDVDGDALTYEVVGPPAHGTLTGTPPALTLTPEVGYVGDDAITYRAHDAALASADAVIHLQIGPGESPTATSEAVTLAEDTATAVTLHGRDPDGNPLTYTVVSPPAHGTVTGTPPTLSYTPAANFNGEDALTFAVSNGYASSAAATLTLHVLAVNDAPVAFAQTVAATEDTALTITLAGSDVEGSALGFAVRTPPAHGTLGGAGASRTYTPAANYSGPDSFTFVASDGDLSSTPATIAIDVAPTDDAPVATPGTLAVAEDVPTAVTLVASDPDGDPVTVAIATAPAHGTLSGAPPALTYTPAADYHGPDSFTFTATAAGVTSAPATVAITVTPVNDAPVATDTTVTTPEDTAVAVTLSASDVDGDALSFTLIQTPIDGVLTGSDATWQYTPAHNATGTRTLQFRVSDGALTAIGTVTLVITPVNDPPVAHDDFVATDVGTALVVDAAANDTDVEGDPLFVVSATAAHGSAAVVGGKVIYTPAPGFTGVDVFDYTVSDGHGGTGTGKIHLGVGAFPPDAPSEILATVGRVTSSLPENTPAISSDGRVIAMVTTAALVPDDTNGTSDIYVFDRGTRTLARVSVTSAGAEANGFKQRPRLSADGRYVVFESDSTNLVAGDSNHKVDVFRHDRVTGETVRISVATGGAEGNGDSLFASISDDGNLVAFASLAFNLVDNDANGAGDVFVRDVAAGTTTRVSVTASGGETDLFSSTPDISGDGRFVAFVSPASNLVAGDTNNTNDVFVRDRIAGVTTRVSVSTTGVQGDRASGGARISRDGRFISFVSSATNLVPGVTSSSALYVRDTQAQTQTFTGEASVFSPGALSADGRYIAADGFDAVFIRDRFGASTVRPPGSAAWELPALSSNGRYLVVIDSAGRLVVTPNPL